jgi:hypothetical protein
MPKAPKESSLQSFHIVLADGTERDVKGSALQIIGSGALVIENPDAGAVAYAPGTWKLCELERKDDR